MTDRADPDIEALLSALRANQHHTTELVHEVARTYSMSPAELLNALALAVAERFMAGHMLYDDADDLANTIYAVMMNDAVLFGNGFVLPQPAFDIYEAFDAGEWDRGDGSDPVERFTKPMLRKILGDDQGRPSPPL